METSVAISKNFYGDFRHPSWETWKPLWETLETSTGSPENFLKKERFGGKKLEVFFFVFETFKNLGSLRFFNGGVQRTIHTFRGMLQ